MDEEYRTVNDVWKELADSYCKLGKLLGELNRMLENGQRKETKQKELDKGE